MRPDIIQVTFVVQLALITVYLLLALVRAQRLRRDATPPSDHSPQPVGLQWSSPEGVTRVTNGVGDNDIAEARALKADCDRLARSLEKMRAEHAAEEEHFRARRREALLEMHEHRRITAELGEIEPKLQERVDGLRAQVEHLEHRRVALAAEVSASLRTSAALRDRAILAQRELASLRLDRERVGRRIRSDGQRLRDLARRRAVLRAETEELAALLELLQKLADQPRTLTFLSDGELREAAARRAAPVDGSAVTANVAAEAATRIRPAG
jgi:outer membrane murein-binding lipoprotein Lpp